MVGWCIPCCQPAPPEEVVRGASFRLPPRDEELLRASESIPVDGTTAVLELRGRGVASLKGSQRLEPVSRTLSEARIEDFTTEEAEIEAIVRKELPASVLRIVTTDAAWHAVPRTVKAFGASPKRVEETKQALRGIAESRVVHKLEELARGDPIVRRRCMDLARSWAGIRLSGFDAMRHPIVVEKIAETVPILQSKAVSDDDLVAGRVYCTEILQAVKAHVSVDQTVLKHVYILDMTGVRFRSLNSRVRQRARMVIQHLELVYPGVVWRTYIVNAPESLRIVWNIVSMWLHPLTRDRIKILSCDKQASKKRLMADGIPEAAIPAECGGTGPRRSEYTLSDLFEEEDRNNSEEEYRRSRRRQQRSLPDPSALPQGEVSAGMVSTSRSIETTSSRSPRTLQSLALVVFASSICFLAPWVAWWSAVLENQHRGGISQVAT